MPLVYHYTILLNEHSFRTYALHIFTLVSLVVAQPVLQQLTQNPTFFVAHGAKTLEILGFLAILCLLLPLPFLVIELAASFFGPRSLRAVHHVFLFVFFSGFSALVLKQLSFFSGFLAILFSSLGGLIFVILYYRMSIMRTAVTLLSVLIIAVPLLFAFDDSVRRLIWSGKISGGEFSKTSSTTPVVMVLFDELPVSSLMNEKLIMDSALYPNFTALLKDFTWYRNTTTISPVTHRAVPSILTGKYPVRTLLPTLTDHPENLFTLLAGSHELRVFESVTSLCPEKLNKIKATSTGKSSVVKAICLDAVAVYLQLIVPPPYSSSLPDVSSTWGDFWNTSAAEPKKGKIDRGELFENFVRSIVPSQEPFLSFLHVSLPHRPWRYLPNGQQYFDFGEGQKQDQFWEKSDWAAIVAYQRHLLQLGYADKLLGDLIRKLKDTGIYDRALIVITADHGISVWPGGRQARQATTSTYQDILLVPFFIKGPMQKRGTIIDRKLETVDILPTIAGMLELEMPWKTDGVSATRTDLPEREYRKVFLSSETVSDLTCDIREENRTLKRKNEIFGKATSISDIYQIGPFPELLNKDVNGLHISSENDFRVTIRGSDELEEVDLNATTIPSYIAGEVKSPTSSQDLVLAIAANGKIRTVTRTFFINGKLRFGALLPKTSLQNGKNTIEVIPIPDVGQQRADRYQQNPGKRFR
ncbi:sulfatase-like hydrolase/transferase [bacterium]|nr:sulfatase-like hydrolase/transferase [bacterium]